ncbi:hypothetical protein Asal01_02144 [Fodinibius salicampi]
MSNNEKELSDRKFQILQSRLRDHDKSHSVAYALWFFLGYISFISGK